MTVFDEALRRTLFYEGGYSNDAHDPGGATKFGVSLRFLKGLGKLGDIDHDGDVDIDDLRRVAEDPDKLSKLYYDNFWIPANCQRIYSEHLQIKLFDTAVNVGPKRAQIFMQHAYNLNATQNSTLILAEDGSLGSGSVAAINSLLTADWRLLMTYRGVQGLFYDALCNKPGTEVEVYRLGWQRRAAT